MSKVVLITSIGGDIAQGVAAILRESRPDYRLIGTDIHFKHGGHLFVDQFEVVPPASHSLFLPKLQELIVKHNVDTLVPISEPELSVLYPLLGSFAFVNCVTSGAHAIATGLDKLRTIHEISKLDIPVPWTVEACSNPPLSYPCILKNRYGSGSRAVFRIDDPEDAAYFAKKYPESIFQEFLEPSDREVTCAVYRAISGESASLLLLRRLTGGLTGWAKVIQDEDTSKMCCNIANGLDLRGSMNIQLRITDQGPRVFEINPRFSSTVLMRHRLGFSDVLWSIDEINNASIAFPEICQGINVARIHDARVFD